MVKMIVETTKYKNPSDEMETKSKEIFYILYQDETMYITTQREAIVIYIFHELHSLENLNIKLSMFIISLSRKVPKHLN